MILFEKIDFPVEGRSNQVFKLKKTRILFEMGH